MSRRLEWQPVAAQGLNPLGAMGTSISAFQGAAGTVQALRNSERADDALIQNSYSDLIKSHLGAGQLDLNYQKEAREAKKEDFNPAVAERIFTDHFIAGGTPEDFLDNPNVMGLVNEYGDSAFTQGIQSFNRFNTGVEKEATKLTGLAETKKAARLLEIDRMGLDESVAASMKSEIEDEYVNTLAGIQAEARNNFINSRQTRSRYLGLEPAEGTAGGGSLLPTEDGALLPPAESGAPVPAAERQAAKSNEFADYMGQLESEYAAESERIDREYTEGRTNDAEYFRQREELDEGYNQKLRDLGKEDRKYNITSSTGERLTFDYTDLPDGGIQVGNQVLPGEVSSAFRSAVDAFDVPMEVMLSFTVKESSMNPKAVSDKGVVGLMQVTKETGREMFEKNREVFEAYGITADTIDDRDNPLVSALTGAAYIAHIRDNILHGDAPIEQVYVAYNIGPNDPLVKQFHNKNVPIDKLPGVNLNSIGIRNNINVYYDKKRDAWRTPAQVSALVRERMKLTPAGEDPVTAISNVAQSEPEKTSNETVVDAELKNVKATSKYHQFDFNRDPIGELDYAVSVANSVIPMKTLGTDGKLGAQISATEYSDMLTVMGVDPDPKRIQQLYKLVNTHDVLPTLPAEEVSNILSFGVKNTWLSGGGLDEASTLANIEGVLNSWDSHREKIRAQMGSAANIKKYATDFSATREKLQGKISGLESSLRKFEGRELNRTEEKAKQETARFLASSQRELASATAMYQGLIQEDYEKILRFRDELEATRVTASSAKAAQVVKELEEKNKNKKPGEINGKTSGELIRERYPMAPWIGG